MDFDSLMNMASSKQEKKDKMKINRYSLDLPPAKKEEKVKKVTQEKEKEKEKGRERKQEKSKSDSKDRKRGESRETEEKKKNNFRIPKKKADAKIDTDSLIDSLFDDSTIPPNDVNGNSKSSSSSNHGQSQSANSKTSSSHSSSSSKHKDKDKNGSSGSKHKSSQSSGNSDHHSSKSSSSSTSRDEGTSKHHSKSSSSKSHSSSSSSTSHSKLHSSSSSSSSSKSKSHVPSSSSSKSKSSSSIGKSSQSASSDSKPSSSSNSHERKPSDERPVTLSKHHLQPTTERQATSTYQSEKDKILARLQAIKERTLAAIQKEGSTKGKRARAEKGSRKTKEDEKEDPRVKSKEIIRDVVSSSEEEDIPEALDIMLSERNAKLEKEKIARMAKQAWERAMRKDRGEPADDVKAERRKRKAERRPREEKAGKGDNHVHKRKERAHSLSPGPNDEQRQKPAKSKIVRHARNAAPPPMDFQALLAMAEKKQKEPQKADEPAPKKKKKEKEERPMTQEEKERHERVKSKDYQLWLKFGGKHPKSKDRDESDDERQSTSKNKTADIRKGTSSGGKPSAFAKYIERENGKVLASRIPGASVSRDNRNITVNENVLVCGSAEDSEVETPSPQEKIVRENPFDRLFKQVHKKKASTPPVTKKKRLEDSENESEEEDYSDMDDFIDNGEEELDYSREIKNIFGYDKSRYQHVDEDVSNMEANFSTIMKEETRSAKIGKMEDLEDIRREQEELRRKAMMKKKMKT